MAPAVHARASMTNLDTIDDSQLATIAGGAQRLPQLARICQDGTRLYEQNGTIYTRQDRRTGFMFTKRPYFVPVGAGKTVDDICPGGK
jgi:hypothetical protein